jgi:hypothetical protein
MPKLPDETIYMKVDGKFKAVGKIYDHATIGYGNYFVYSNKYSRGVRKISASPDPDFIGLESAIEESRDNLEKQIIEIFNKSRNSGEYLFYYNVCDDVIEAIRKTFLDKKKEMLKLMNK